MDRAEQLKHATPELTVDLTLYPTNRGGRKGPIMPGWGSPCTVQAEEGDGWVCYDGWPLLGNMVLAPGQTCRVGYVFLSGQQAANILSAPRKFYLWERGLIGEAVIVES